MQGLRRHLRQQLEDPDAYRMLNRAITFVYRLSLTTAVYSSGPVTPWMWNVGVVSGPWRVE